VNTLDAIESGKIIEFLRGITTAGVVPTDGMKKADLKEFPNLEANLPANRFSVMTVVASVKRLYDLMEENGFKKTFSEMEALRDSLKEMEEYLELNPSSTSFLRNPFAEQLVENMKSIEETFQSEVGKK